MFVPHVQCMYIQLGTNVYVCSQGMYYRNTMTGFQLRAVMSDLYNILLCMYTLTVYVSTKVDMPY